MGKYGVLSESLEEGLQQSVSYANLDRVQSSDYDSNANGFERVWDLVTSSGETLQNAAKGNDLDARKQILDAVGQGAKLAALFGGPTAVTFDIASNPVQQTSSQATVKPVQSPTERDIINTEKLWTQQLNEAAGIQPEEVQMVNAEDAEGTHTTELSMGQMTDLNMEGNTLTDVQKSRLNTLNNTINDHLTENDFSGTLRDLQGNPVPNGKGGYYDHLAEMKDSYRSLQKIRRALEGSLKNPNLSDIDRSLLQDGLDNAIFYLNRIEKLFDPYGGIN